MTRLRKLLGFALMPMAFLLAACGRDGVEPLKAEEPPPPIAGTYNCAPANQAGPPDVVVLHEDGSLIITKGDAAGARGIGLWSAKGTSGAFNPGTKEQRSFRIDGKNLVFPDGAVCAPSA